MPKALPESQTEKRLRLLEKLFYIYLFVNPFIDMINGFILNTFSVSFGISLILRMALLALMGLYILLRRDWRTVLLLIPVGLSAVLSLIPQAIYWELHLFTEAQYIARFLYNLAALVVFHYVLQEKSHNKKDVFLELLDRLFTWCGAWVSLSLLVPLVLKLGASAYKSALGGIYGFKGFYFAGNEATAILITIFPMVLCRALKLDIQKPVTWKTIGLLVVPALMVNSLLIIGTKTAFAGLFLAVGCIGLYVLVSAIRKKTLQQLFVFLIVIGMACSVFFVLDSMSNIKQMIKDSQNAIGNTITNDGSDIYTDEVLEKLEEWDQMAVTARDTFLGRLLSGRLGFLGYTFDEFKHALPLSALVGIGRGSRPRTIEMDFFEIFMYYGLFGAFFLLWPFWQRGSAVIKKLLRDWNFTGFCGLVACITTLGYAFMAGHVLFTVTGGWYLILVMIYLGRLYDIAPPSLPSWISRWFKLPR